MEGLCPLPNSGRGRYPLKSPAIDIGLEGRKVKRSDVRPKILLDEGFHGMADFLRDRGWQVICMGKSETDDTILDRAKSESCIVVTGDEQLLHRCRREGLDVIDVGFKGQLSIVEKYLKARHRATG